MADPVFGLTATAAKQVGQVVREVLRTLPETGRRTRRVIGNNRSSGGIYSNNGDSGCCCNAMKCVRLCDLTVSDVVTECAACPVGATKTYTIAVATGSGWMPASAKVTHVAGGCTWESASFSITIKGVTGTYKWRLVQAGASSTLTLTYVSGYDPVNACAGYYTPVTIRYTATTGGQAWSCLCNSQMTLTTDRTKIPFGSGLAGEICVVPGGITPLVAPCDVINYCYSLSVAGVTGTCTCAASIYNGDFVMMPLSSAGGCCFGSRGSRVDVGSGIGGGSPDCTCTSPAFDQYLWCFDQQAGVLQWGNIPCSGFTTNVRVIYYLTSGVVGTGGDLVFTLNHNYIADACGAGYVVFPNTLTLHQTDCSYTGGDCNCPGGGTGDGCAGSATWTWTSGAWVLTTTSCTVGPPCTTSCSAPAPERAGAFESEAVVVNCTCNP